jgi:hypothetical protein
MPYCRFTNKMSLSNIKPGQRLRWQHRNAAEVRDFAQSAEQLERIVNVKAVFEDYIKTDFGDYFIHTGCNVDAACGCKHFCNCWGRVETLENDFVS